MSVHKKYFGTDGIRGEANVGLTPELALRVGQATGLQLQNTFKGPLKVLLGKDTRLSGYMLEPALVAGFVSAGLEVIQTGPIPTPAVAMLVRSMRCDVGAMITASHNPFSDNGIKLFGADGYKLSDALEEEIESLIDSDMTEELSRGNDLGRAKRIDGVADRYIEFAKRTFPSDLELDGTRIVIDCANGAAYKVAPQVLRELGAEVFSIGVDPNGTNINENCGSMSPQTLVKKVKEHRADLGIALDGDADRVLLVDANGQKVDGDQMLALIALYLKEANRLSNPLVIGTQMTNMGLERHLASSGISLMRANVGDRYVLEAMREKGACLGGEPSGHIILSEYGTTGDGLVAALQVLAIAARRKRPVTELLHCFRPFPQILDKVPYNKKNGNPLERLEIAAAIAAAKEQLGENGRIVVRASGTEPVIRIMVEASDERQVREIAASIKSSFYDL